MKIVRMTFKSTACRTNVDLIKEWEKYTKATSIKEGTIYRVLFTDLPEYLENKWRECAEGICPEIEKPGLELEAVLMPNGDMCGYEFKYYFDDYITFDVEEEDAKEMCDLYTNFCLKHGGKYPDAYDANEGFNVGDGDWEDKILENYDINNFTIEPCPWCGREEVIHINGVTRCRCGKPLAPCSACDSCNYATCPFGCDGTDNDDDKPCDYEALSDDIQSRLYALM